MKLYNTDLKDFTNLFQLFTFVMRKLSAVEECDVGHMFGSTNSIEFSSILILRSAFFL